MAPIVLASRSDRRKKALRKIISKFRMITVPEPRVARGKTIRQKTQYLAFSKAAAGARRFPRSIIIAADTLAECGKKILGKPRNRTDAARMLVRMSGHRMNATTSIAVHSPKTKKIIVWSENGWVRFRHINKDEMKKYLSSRMWMGKAGAVNIEEKPVKDWIVKTGGERDAVIGLPLKRLRRELGENKKRRE